MRGTCDALRVVTRKPRRPRSMSCHWRESGPRGDDYDAAFAARERAGQNVHGEADFVMRLQPRTVLDAGCGTGRVAIELARHGAEVVGVDLAPRMLDTA